MLVPFCADMPASTLLSVYPDDLDSTFVKASLELELSLQGWGLRLLRVLCPKVTAAFSVQPSLHCAQVEISAACGVHSSTLCTKRGLIPFRVNIHFK